MVEKRPNLSNIKEFMLVLGDQKKDKNNKKQQWIIARFEIVKIMKIVRWSPNDNKILSLASSGGIMEKIMKSKNRKIWNFLLCGHKK